MVYLLDKKYSLEEDAMRTTIYFFTGALFLLSSCTNEKVKEDQQLEVSQEERVQAENDETSITIGAAGDVLLHGRVYKRMQESDGYDFTPALENVVSMLEEPDFMIVNQESIPGGEEIGLSAYPSFNSPYEIVDALQEAGVDMVTGANNHTMDRGMEAVYNSISYYEEVGMNYVGVYKDEEDADTPRIVSVEDIDIGVLSYTYGLNGYTVPDGHEYAVQLIDQDVIQEEIREIEKEVDVLMVSMHWGAEYERLPNDEQKELASFLADEGVDVVIGHHPHVLQPMEWVEGEEGNETLVYYSLGNFYSGQNYKHTDTGGIATFQVKKGEGEIVISEPNVDFTQVVQGPGEEYIVMPMAEAEHPPIGGETEQELRDHAYQWMDK